MYNTYLTLGVLFSETWAACSFNRDHLIKFAILVTVVTTAAVLIGYFSYQAEYDRVHMELIADIEAKSIARPYGRSGAEAMLKHVAGLEAILQAIKNLWVLFAGLLLVAGLCFSIVGSGLTVHVARQSLGRNEDVGSAFMAVYNRIGACIGLFLLIWLIRWGSSFVSNKMLDAELVMPLVAIGIKIGISTMVGTLLLCAIPAMFMEGISPFSALGRSISYAGRAFFTLFFALLVLGVLITLPFGLLTGAVWLLGLPKISGLVMLIFIGSAATAAYLLVSSVLAGIAWRHLIGMTEQVAPRA